METTVQEHLVMVMRHMGFQETSINTMLEFDRVKEAKETQPELEFLSLKLFFNHILIKEPTLIKDGIRASINLPKSPKGWVDEMTLKVLPYFKEHEEIYF